MTVFPGTVGVGNSLACRGLGGGTDDIAPMIAAAKADGLDVIFVPRGAAPWPMTTPLTLSDATLIFEPGAQISFDMSVRAMDLTNVRLVNASFTSPFTGPSSAADNDAAGDYRTDAREVRLNDGCVVENYTHENAAGGLNITAGAHVRVRDVTIRNIRHYLGWGAAIHIGGASSYDVRIRDYEFENCDRGIEVEAGASDVLSDGGHMENIWPSGYTGQPAGYATYTFVLDVHSHSGEGACRNVVHRNARLVNCGGGVTFLRSSGGASDMPRNCRAENIGIVGDLGATGYDMVTVQGYSHRVSNVVMQGGSTAKRKVRVFAGSENVRLEGIRGEGASSPFLTVDAEATGTVTDDVRNVA